MGSAGAQRCTECSKKVGLLPFTCRCGKVLCTIHRLASQHDCGFDYRTVGREKLALDNQLVVAPKVARIVSLPGK